MPIVTTACLILQTFRFGDTSKILRLLTRDYGPVSALARGALRPKSRLSGALEPFVEGQATLYMKANRDLHTLSAFDLVRSRQALGADMSRFAGASVLAELVLRLAPAERDDALYGSLRDGLDALLDSPQERVSGEAIFRVWDLIGILGFEPAVESCRQCGRTELDSEVVYFDTRQGGIHCAQCGREGRALESAELAELRKMLRGGSVSRPSAVQFEILREFIRVHAAEEIRIRSLDFFGPSDD